MEDIHTVVNAHGSDMYTIGSDIHTVERRDIHMEGHTHGRDRQTHEIQPEKIDAILRGLLPIKAKLC